MKRIIITIFVLLAAMIAMAWLYFSRLNVQSSVDYTSLYAASTNSALVVSVENDKNIHKILQDQVLFENLLGEEKYNQLLSLKKNLIDLPSVNAYVEKQNFYFGFPPGNNKDINFLITTQLATGKKSSTFFSLLKSNGIELDSADQLLKIKLKDNSSYYLGMEKQLLLISNAAEPIKKAIAGLKDRSNHDFVEYIRANKRMSTNTLACLHINFKHFPALLKNIMPGKLSNELEVLDNQPAFATLTYNFSKEKLLFNGSTFINDTQSYYNLFSESLPVDMNAAEILPEQTANYVIYGIANYPEWKSGLDNWLKSRKENKAIDQLMENVASKYRLDLKNIFTLSFNNQLITFQMSNGERLGAINVKNAPRFAQLLLDISEDYSPNIKILKEPGILYAFFGQPVEDFKRPYYSVIGNYMVFSNSGSAIRSFLENYQGDKQLVNTQAYSDMNAQLPVGANISFYVDNDNSEPLFRRNIYLPFYRHIRDKKGLRNFSSMVYQLTGDKGKFQTNLLLILKPDTPIQENN